MNIRQFKNKKILIIGYGKEGKSIEAYLHEKYPHLTIAHTDTHDGPTYLDKQKFYDYAIRSPSVPPSLITIPHTTPTNIFFSLVKGITIGITGTKGKSTTASLIHAILCEAKISSYLVGNIGEPMINALRFDSSKTHYVCELSSYQLEDIEYSPHISIIINFFPEHMDHHGNTELYLKAKLRIAQKSKSSDFFIFNPRFPELVAYSKSIHGQSIPIMQKLPFSKNKVSLLGKHNEENLRIALTVGSLLHIPHSTMERAIKKFKALPHRLEYIGRYKEISFYDDAISTTPESTIAAVNSLSAIGAIFLGGLDRGYDFSKLVNTIITKRIPYIVLFPDSGTLIGDLLGQKKHTSHIFHTSSMRDAVDYVYKNCPKDAICLLSCASPSYSLWKNFEEKGDDFQHWVRLLGR